MTKTIDLRPTWTGLAPVLIAILEEGSLEGRVMARQEILRMAAIADAHVASQTKDQPHDNA